jgi:hypothetical protein
MTTKKEEIKLWTYESLAHDEVADIQLVIDKEWLQKVIQEDYDCKDINVFMSEYTYDDTLNILKRAERENIAFYTIPDAS